METTERILYKTLFFLFLIFTSCDIQITDDHFPVSSSSIKESKHNGVFIGSYSFSSPIILNHKGVEYTISEIFVENKYKKSHSKEIGILPGEQMVIVLNNTIDNRFNLDWELRSENGMHFTGGYSKELHSSMKYKQLDSIVLNVYDISKKPETKLDYTCLLTLKEKITTDAQEVNPDVPILILPDD